MLLISYEAAKNCSELVLDRKRNMLRPHYHLLFISNFGPSGVHALPLAAGRNEGGHYYRYVSSYLVLILLLPPVFKIPEGIVVGFQIFAWASN
jgi:hypothetical protein